MDEGLERLEDLLAEFNPFDVLKIERRETQHSALLAWLLDPRGSHGLRDYFLRRFLSEAAAKAQEEGVGSVTPLDVDGWDLGGIEVATERHNIDILLTDEGDEFFCIIENKIGAGEHSNQLARYLRIAESEYEGLVPFPIFLTPDGIEPESAGDAGRYVPLGYEKVADLIDRTLRTRGSSISTSVSGFLEQYARTLRRHVMTDADNIDELALQIYNKHRAAIDLIIKARPALEAQGWDVLDSAIAQYEPLLQGDGNSKWYHRFYAPELEGIPEIRGSTDGRQRAGCCCSRSSTTQGLSPWYWVPGLRRRAGGCTTSPRQTTGFPGSPCAGPRNLVPHSTPCTAGRCWGRKVRLSPTTSEAGNRSRTRSQPFSTATTGGW